MLIMQTRTVISLIYGLMLLSICSILVISAPLTSETGGESSWKVANREVNPQQLRTVSAWSMQGADRHFTCFITYRQGTTTNQRYQRVIRDMNNYAFYAGPPTLLYERVFFQIGTQTIYITLQGHDLPWMIVRQLARYFDPNNRNRAIDYDATWTARIFEDGQQIATIATGEADIEPPIDLDRQAALRTLDADEDRLSLEALISPPPSTLPRIGEWLCSRCIANP